MSEQTDIERARIPADEILVGGAWRRGRGERLAVLDPCDGSELAWITSASVEDVDEAVERGLAAAADPAWADLLPAARARILHAIAGRVEADAERLALLQTLNTGKTLAETGALVASAVGTFRYFAAVLEVAEQSLTPSRGPYLTFTLSEPFGVVGAITPWNSPVASDAQKVAPALAAGNAVVLKPAEWTPLVSLALGRLMEEAGLPAGLLSVLPGRGSDVGDALVRHPGVGKVSFTGGTATGRLVGRAAAEKIMPVSLELGGKSPTVVFEDADVDQAVAGVMFGIFSSTGQSCIAGSRLFVHASVYEPVLGRLVEATGRLRLGPGTDPSTQVGPMVAVEHRDKVAAYVDKARADGGRVLCGGATPSDPALVNGAYYLPTVIEGLDPQSLVCQEEVFGPVLVVLPFEHEDDLVRQANATEFGLACGLWTADYRRAWRLARRIDAGTVWINTYKQFSISTPFGGQKSSGIGLEKGLQGIRAYSRQKSVYLGLDEAPLPWAGL